MLYDTVTEGGGENLPYLGKPHAEADARTRDIPVFLALIYKLHQVLLVQTIQGTLLARHLVGKASEVSVHPTIYSSVIKSGDRTNKITIILVVVVVDLPTDWIDIPRIISGILRGGDAH